MSQHIGIVACSAEGAALCYRTICIEGSDLLGRHSHPEITMHTFPLSKYEQYFAVGDWDSVAGLMLLSVNKVADAGAEFAICPDNTIHQAFDLVIGKTPIPWLHIADVVIAEAEQRDYRLLGILGTSFLMEGPVYSTKLSTTDIKYLIPEFKDRERINNIIFSELVYGCFSSQARDFLNNVIGKFKQQDCDAVVLGCTEIPLIITPDSSPLPILDSTRLLARAALNKAVELNP